MTYWLIPLTGYRVLMTWVYSQTKSVLVAMAMHGSWTGWQFFLTPASTTPGQDVVWHLLLSAGIWVVALVAVTQRALSLTGVHSRPHRNDDLRARGNGARSNGGTNMTRRSSTSPALLCAAIATMAGVVAAIGVFARGDGSVVTATSVRGVEFDMATTGVYAYNAQRVVAEGVGWDLFTLLVAVPALFVAAYLVNSGSFRGSLFGIGALGYFLYQYLEYSVTWAFGPLFLAFIVLYAASLVGIVWIAAGIAQHGVAGRFRTSFPRRGWAALSTVMALLLTVLWLARIGAGLRGDLVTAGLTSETTLTIQALDLGLLVPALLVSALLVARRREVGFAFAAALAVTFVGMALAIVGMLLSAWAVEGTLEVAPVAIFGVAAVAGLAIGIRAYRSIKPDGRAAEQAGALHSPVTA